MLLSHFYSSFCDHSLIILCSFSPFSPPDLFLLTAQPLIEHVSYLFHDKISQDNGFLTATRGGGIAAKLHPEPILIPLGFPNYSRESLYFQNVTMQLYYAFKTVHHSTIM